MHTDNRDKNKDTNTHNICCRFLFFTVTMIRRTELSVTQIRTSQVILSFFIMAVRILTTISSVLKFKIRYQTADTIRTHTASPHYLKPIPNVDPNFLFTFFITMHISDNCCRTFCWLLCGFVFAYKPNHDSPQYKTVQGKVC